LAVAVITAVTFELTTLAGAVKPTLLDPAVTVTLAGTTRLAELLARLIAKPAAPATPFSVTVQETLPAPAIAAGLQDKADI
jgi:siroheme synthase